LPQKRVTDIDSSRVRIFYRKIRRQDKPNSYAKAGITQKVVEKCGMIYIGLQEVEGYPVKTWEIYNPSVR